jgi:hypothetical protein
MASERVYKENTEVWNVTATRLSSSVSESIKLLHSPRFINGIVKSINCSLSCVIVRSQIARSAL